MADIWADLRAESRRPGSAMTITKAQYFALTNLLRLARPYVVEVYQSRGIADPIGRHGDELVGQIAQVLVAPSNLSSNPE